MPTMKKLSRAKQTWSWPGLGEERASRAGPVRSARLSSFPTDARLHRLICKPKFLRIRRSSSKGEGIFYRDLNANDNRFTPDLKSTRFYVVVRTGGTNWPSSPRRRCQASNLITGSQS